MGPHHDAYEVVVSLLRKLTVGAWCFIFSYYPAQSILAHQHPLRPTLTLQHMMWCWRQDLMGPHHDAYEVEVSLLRKLTVGAWCFIFPTTLRKVYLLTSTRSGRH